MMQTLKTKYLYPSVLSGALLALPVIAAAQQVSGSSGRFIGNVNRLITLAVTFLIIVAGLIFIWGVIKFLASGDDAAARGKATGFILFGIIGIAVILAFWGLVRVILDYFGFAEGEPSVRPPELQRLPGGTGSSGGGG